MESRISSKLYPYNVMAPQYTIAKDDGSAVFAGAKKMPVHPEHKKATNNLTSMAFLSTRYYLHVTIYS